MCTPSSDSIESVFKCLHELKKLFASKGVFLFSAELYGKTTSHHSNLCWTIIALDPTFGGFTLLESVSHSMN